MIEKIINWFLKIWFYFNFFTLRKRNNTYSNKNSIIIFESTSFEDGQWNKYLPWNMNNSFPEWNTYDKTAFPKKWVNNVCVGYQSGVEGTVVQYGKFFVKAKLDGIVSQEGWPAIWLYEEKSLADVADGKVTHPYYYEIDIEIGVKGKKRLELAIHVNHNGGGDKSYPGYHVIHSIFRSKRLFRELQKNVHIYCIDWSNDKIKYYLDRILIASFKNEIPVAMQLILSKLNMSYAVITKKK